MARTMNLKPVFQVSQGPNGKWGPDDIYFNDAEEDEFPPLTDGLPGFATRDEAQKIADLLTEAYAKGGRYNPDTAILKKISLMIGENPNNVGLHDAMQMNGINPANV